MQTDTAVETPVSEIQAENLTRRATLTFVSSLLQQGARFIVGFCVTPIIIRVLGADLYGAWGMIQQTIGYASLGDLRPMGTLRLTLSVRQHLDDVEEKRRQIGAALLFWVFTLPLFLLLGITVIWAAPKLIRLQSSQVLALRLAMGLMVFSMLLDRLVSLPANVLRGMNLDYKAMGLNAATILLGGILTVLAIWMGGGLPGLGAAVVVSVFISNGVRLWVARQVLPWIGIAWPSRDELLNFSKLSGWLSLAALSDLLLKASDLLLIGFLLGPKAAAIFATTSAAICMAAGPVAQIAAAGTPGMAGLCGQKDWPRVQRIRHEMHMVSLVIMSLVGFEVLCLNESFLRLWLGEGFYAGNITNFLLVLIFLTEMITRIDGSVVAGMMEIKSWAMALLVSGLSVIALGVILIPILGFAGMALGILVGRLILITYQSILIRNINGYPIIIYWRSMSRLCSTVIILFISSFIFSFVLIKLSWIGLLAFIIGLSLIFLVIIWIIGLGKREKVILLGRLTHVFRYDNA